MDVQDDPDASERDNGRAAARPYRVGRDTLPRVPVLSPARGIPETVVPFRPAIA